jgi:hypothetical protein
MSLIPSVAVKAPRRSSALPGIVAALAISLCGMNAHAANPKDAGKTPRRRS